MNMRKLSTYFIIFTCLILSSQSCKQKEVANTQEADSTLETTVKEVTNPGFVHAVYFWLKKDNPELVKEFIAEGLPKLAEVPSIQSVSWGPPAGTPREVVDNSYDLAWIVNFATAEDQDAYQVDSLHVAFVEKYKTIFDKVQVYDNIVTSHVSE